MFSVCLVLRNLSKAARFEVLPMKSEKTRTLKDGDRCTVVAGPHKGKSGLVRDINTSKSGNVTLTVVQVDGVRFKTLGKNVVVLGV